jgi:Putative restriction endonuclease
VQSAITLDDSEPEPDLAIVSGSARNRHARHPGPVDIALLIEMSDSSLANDRNDKARVYARANIVCYWIVNLVDRRVEVYTDPTGPGASPAFRQHRDCGLNESVPLVIGGQEVAQVPVRDLLP